MSLNTMATIERGLQSSHVADHISAIAQCAKAIRDNPFPTSVNTILLRLVDIFHGDKPKMDQSLNLIRLRIVKLLSECNLDLSASQDDPIVRCIMKVSHSNDYKARSLAMLFLAAVAPVVHANKKVHYLLLEALDCSDLTELTSTIIAVGSVGRLSSDFSSTVVTKIGEMLLSEDVDKSIKIRLMEDLSSFQQKLEVTKYCMELGKRLLQSNPEHRMCVAIICGLTEMAKQNGLGLGEHITLILDEIGKTNDNETLMNCCLTNLLELAQLPHHWDDSQVLKLFNYQGNVCQYGSSKPLILWLQALTHLIRHTHASVLPTNDLFDRILPLSQINNFTVKIYLIKVLYTRLEYDVKSEKGVLLNNLLSEITVELSKTDSAICLNDRIKFYKMMAFFITTQRVKALNIDALVFAEFLISIDDQYPEQVFLKSLETLNLLCETNQRVGRLICSRSINILCSNYGQDKKFLDAPMELYSLAFLPFPGFSAQVKDIISRVQEELKQDKRWWFAFKLARLGLRYGHWIHVSLPLLERIQGNCDSIEVSTFITTLIHVAKSELPKPFDISQLNAARHNLRHASLLLKPLVQTSRNSSSFTFAVDYIDCLYEMFGAFNTVLISLNTNKNFEVGPRTLNQMEYTKISMDGARVIFTETRKKWIALQQRSFDADEHTQQQLELFARYCQLFESILVRIFASDFTAMAPIVPHATSTVNCQLEQLISWGINQTNESIHAVTGPELQRANIWKNNFDRFFEIFTYLSQIPLCLPRAFFQQVNQTKIKLNVTPQPKEREQALTLSSKQLALSVEGFVETTNPKRIQRITVYVHVYYADRENDSPVVDSRSCDVCDNYFFKVNFLLNVARNAEIVTSLSFMDSTEKRTWKMGALNQFQVIASDTH